MEQLNVMKAIKENKEKINYNYDLSLKQIKEIENNCSSKWELTYNFFVIGYVQGKKAAKAEMRKAGKNQ